MQQLAIVLPAYRPDFLEQALQSIENQTDKRFQVYVGNDASPFELESICQPFVERNAWFYTRFSENLGSHDLVNQWNRCVRLSSEAWVWLFSDDDVMSPECVKGFYEALEQGPESNVLRFNLQIINEAGEVVKQNTMPAQKVSDFTLGERRFNRQLISAAVEYVFRRAAFEREMGFINFPLAWCSDDASWIAFSGGKPILLLPNGLVSWRMSAGNISSLANHYVQRKIDASVLFINWFNTRFANRIDTTLKSEQIIWLRLQMVHLDFQPGFQEVLSILKKLNIPLSIYWLRAFDDLYCLTYVYWKKVVRNEPPSGFRYWLHLFLPKF